MASLETWLAAWQALGVARSPALDELHAALVACYREPHRHYHTVRHLDECFALLPLVREALEHCAEVEIALWYHDAIYDTRRNDNEAASARWAERSARVLGAGAAAHRLRYLVMATRHAGEPERFDAQAVCDIDLAILGAEPQRFAEYERDIRREYARVPEAQYRERRAAVLDRFLARPRVYFTHRFSERYEDRARANLAASLGVLRSGEPAAGTSRERAP